MRLKSRAFARAVLASAAMAAATILGGCDTDSIAPAGRSQAPLSDKTLTELTEKDMDKDSPILIRLFKEEAEAEVWKKNRSGEFALLKTYPICRWSGDLGPKFKEGDRQAPEGFYTITPGQMNPNSNYYLAFNMGYPNAFDRAWNRTGSQLMVHGDCSSRGCYAMTDEQMVEIYALAREAFFGGQKAFQVQSLPFRMTAANMAKHRNSRHLAFWKMLKVGSDHFEVTHQEPKVDVCEKRYVFDAAAPADASKSLVFNARGKCPAFEVPQVIASAVAERQQTDNAEYAELVANNTPVVTARTGVDGGMHPTFLAKLKPDISPESDDQRYPVIAMAQTPGALPRTRNNPPALTVLPAAIPRRVEVADATASPAVITGGVPVPRNAPEPKEGVALEPQPITITSLFNGLFASPTAEAQPAVTSAPATATPVPASPKTTRTIRTAAAKRKPAHQPTPVTRVASAPTKPKAKAKPAFRIAAAAAAPALKPRISEDATAQSAPQPATRSAFSAPAPRRGNLLAGAQPVIPAGSFESRWSGLR
jgi:murein L,D-transpeptidase YafK